MVRQVLPVQTIPANGGGIQNVTKTAADQANGHEFANSGFEFLLAINEDAGAKVVTIKSVADQFGRVGDTVLTVPAAAAGVPGVGIAGPFVGSNWNQGATGLINVDLDADTALHLAVVRASL